MAAPNKLFIKQYNYNFYETIFKTIALSNSCPDPAGSENMLICSALKKLPDCGKIERYYHNS